ncbi:MAG: hypothetical protein ABIC04_04535 [Nanoarchaeota archaeon]
MEEVLSVMKKDYGYIGSEKLREHDIPTSNRVFYLGDQFFIKLSKADLLGPEKVYAARLETVRQMGDNDVPVPHIVQTNDKRNYVQLGGYYLDVHKYIPQVEHFKGHPSQIGQVAASMAHYHSVLDRLDSPEIAVLRDTRSPFENGFAANDFSALLSSYLKQVEQIPHELLKTYLKKAIRTL